ncbi:unnamed protein product, partial [Rotaria sp. Silwood2]
DATNLAWFWDLSPNLWDLDLDLDLVSEFGIWDSGLMIGLGFEIWAWTWIWVWVLDLDLDLGFVFNLT